MRLCDLGSSGFGVLKCWMVNKRHIQIRKLHHHELRLAVRHEIISTTGHGVVDVLRAGSSCGEYRVDFYSGVDLRSMKRMNYRRSGGRSDFLSSRRYFFCHFAGAAAGNSGKTTLFISWHSWRRRHHL